MRSGELARRAGISADTIRHYERIGLLKTAPRTQNGYRDYAPASLPRVRLIRRAIALGFSLNELAAILRVRDGGGSPCHAVFAGAKAKLEKIEREIEELKATRRQLQRVLNDWAKRLSATSGGRPAGLLETLPEGVERHANIAHRSAAGALRHRPSNSRPSTGRD
jgi:MerR family transcriptional regulator, Zn(II)-responsive regulator of zntA